MTSKPSLPDPSPIGVDGRPERNRSPRAGRDETLAADDAYPPGHPSHRLARERARADVLDGEPGREPGHGRGVFDLDLTGMARLVLLSVAAGFILQMSGVNPFAPGFQFLPALMQLAQAAVRAAGWVIVNAWFPALIGALVVVPVWAVWRLASWPFRR